MKKFYKDFSALVRKAGGYASHQTALFLLGQCIEMPEELTIVSPRRLTDKEFSDRKIKIIFVKDISGKKTELCKIEDQKIKVSTIEQTLVDLVASRNSNLSYLEVGKYFLTLIYDLQQLIETASKESESSLKRVLFYTAWTGRASWNNFPKFLQRTPVKLYAKLKNNDESYWNRHLFIRFPKEALEKFPEGDLPHLPSTVTKRIVLAQYQPFRQYFANLQILPVFDLPDLAAHFSGFFKDFLQNFKDSPMTVIAQIAKQIDEYPEMIIDWIIKQAEKNNLPDWFITAAGEFIRKNLESKTLQDVIQAVELSLKLQLHSIVLPHLKFVDEKLTEARRFELIESLCERAWKKGELKTLDDILIYLSALVLVNKPDESLKLIAEVRKRFSTIPSDSNASLSYYTAVSLTRIHEFGAAMREIKTCRPYFKNPESDCYQRVGLELIAGHIFQIHGQIKKARNIILNAYRIAKSGKIGKPMLLSILINLTQMEYICGNFLASIKYAKKTLRKIPANEGTTNRYILIKTLLAAQIGVGNLPKAMVYGKKLLKLGKKIASTPRVAFAKLMLAYLYELYGQPASANRAWKIWDEDSVANEFTFMFPTYVEVKVTRLILKGALKKASLLLAKATDKMSGAEGKLESKQFLVHQLMLQGILLVKMHLDDALSVFKKARSIAQTIDECFEKKLLLVVMGSLFPESFSTNELSMGLKFLLSQKAYDPLWFLYAFELYQRKIPEGEQYLQSHINKTHEMLLDNLLSRFPILRKFVPKFCKNEKERTVLLIQPGKSRMMLLKDFKKWRPPSNVFLFDMVNGKWTFHNQKGIIKPATNAHKIFSALLVIKDNRVNLPDLYQSVWQTQFDPEIDKPAVIAALNRCKKALIDISPGIQLDWLKQNNAELEIFVKIKVPWAAFL